MNVRFFGGGFLNITPKGLNADNPHVFVMFKGDAWQTLYFLLDMEGFLLQYLCWFGEGS